jgi:hypothetical protein
MAKGKKSKGKTYVSKGEVGVNNSISKAIRRDRGEAQKVLNAWRSWKRGSPTPRIVQQTLNISPQVAHRDWMRRSWNIKDKGAADGE